MLVKGTVDRKRGNSIRYSFTLPLSIYSISSVSAFFLYLPSRKKEGKQRQIERGRNYERDRDGLYSEKRAAEERGKR